MVIVVVVVVAKLKHTGCSLIKLYQIKNVNISESYIYIIYFWKIVFCRKSPWGDKNKISFFCVEFEELMKPIQGFYL